MNLKGDNNSQVRQDEQAHESGNDSTPELRPKKLSKKKRQEEKISLMEHSLKEFKNFYQKYINRAIQCPVSLQVMTDPVFASNGNTYERSSISDAVRVRGWQCPLTRQKLKPMDFVPNLAMKSLITQYTSLVERLQKINGEEILKKKKATNINRLSIEEYQKKYTHLIIDGPKRLLNHAFKKIVMKDFVRCDWNIIEEMDLSYCEIDDTGIELFLRHSKTQYKKLRILNLDANQIKNVKNLERIQNLKTLSIKHNDKLSEETKNYFKRINLMKGNLKIDL